MLKILRLLLFAAVLAAPVLARAESALWISVDQAPVRVWRSAQAEVLLRLPRGTVVQPLYAQEVWTRVREPGGQQGWVYQGHLSATPQLPALADIFSAAPESMILAEAADTARSWLTQANRSTVNERGLCDCALSMLRIEMPMKSGRNRSTAASSNSAGGTTSQISVSCPSWRNAPSTYASPIG